MISAHAATSFVNLSGNVWTETQTLTQSVTSLTSSFVFDQFDPALGTLTGISLSILESDDSGSFTVDATTNLRVKNPTDYITLYDTQSSGAAYTGSSTGLLTTPGTATTLGHAIAAGSSQTYTLTGKSLISSTPVEKDLTSFSEIYTGTDTVSFGAKITPQLTITGGAGTQNLNNWVNTTKLALVYTYTVTPTVPVVPEPSSALLGGLGALALLRRRRA